MASLNQIQLIGNCGRDPEMRTFPNGGQVCSVSIATTEKWKDKASGELREATEWHNLVFSDKLAEIAAQYLKKGSQVYVSGQVRSRKYQDKDGVDRTANEVRVRDLVMLGGTTKAATNDAAPAKQQRAPAGDFDDGDIPPF